MTPTDPWLLGSVATPALVVDRDVLVANLREMAAIAREHGVELLPHAKTHRMVGAGLLQVEHGADGLCVAKIGEAERFADAGITRLFVAYPVVGRDKAERALALHRRVDLVLGTDSVEGARSLASTFAEAGEQVRLMLAVDSGLGREGVTPESAPEVAEEIAALDGVDLVGVYTHEGSTYGAADDDELAQRSRAVAELMVSTARRIRERGLALPHVSMGSSASARPVAAVEGVTQIRPGIYAFNDVGQIALGNATLETTAQRVVATVVSHPDAGRACIDAGSKALGTDLVPAAAHRDGYPGHGLIVGRPGWVIDKLSEEHGWLRWHGDGEPTPLPVGTRLEIVPNHACMAFASLRLAHVVSGGHQVETWDGFAGGASE